MSAIWAAGPPNDKSPMRAQTVSAERKSGRGDVLFSTSGCMTPLLPGPHIRLPEAA